MKLTGVNLIEKELNGNSMKLLGMLPDRKIADVSSILVIKHNEDYYIAKIRGGYEDRLLTEDFVTYKKSDLNFDSFEEVMEFCDSIVGGFNIVDVTDYRFNI